MDAQTGRATDQAVRPQSKTASDALFNDPEVRRLHSEPASRAGSDREHQTEKDSHDLSFDTASLFDKAAPSMIKTGTMKGFPDAKVLLAGLSSGERSVGAESDADPHPPASHLKERTQGDTVIGKGEDLKAVTSRVLGQDATAEDKESFRQAVEALNNLGPGSGDLKEGQTLKIPGIDSSGRFIHYDGKTSRTWDPADGSSTSFGPDGKYVTHYKDGKTTTSFPNKDYLTVDGSTSTYRKADGSSITTTPDGEIRRTADNITIARDYSGALVKIDGPYLSRGLDVKPDGQGGTVYRHAGDRPEANFALLQSGDGKMEVFDKGPDGRDRVSTTMKDPDVAYSRERLLSTAESAIKDPAELAKFKADMVRFESRASERGLKPEQVTGTYDAVSRLMRSHGFNTTPENRVVLAEQVLSHAATPTSVDQGGHDTCAVASLESNLYTKHPEKAAGLVEEVAANGAFKLSNGEYVHIPTGSLTPDQEATPRVARNGERDFASQIFQVTAVNALYQDTHGRAWSYEQDPKGPHDSGERDRFLGFTWNKEFSGLNLYQRDRINELITGQKDRDLNLPAYYANPGELQKTLEDFHKRGAFPAILSVHTGNPPFGDTVGGRHAVNVIGYDPVKKEAIVDNQAGS
ncbi:MAG: hypothetical protein KC777_19500, partial [Cyanobacteria bacterium HKST-UBA02]|nr:hypothetical protein [Cyanobacteria bacterium HKST-UBA02]